MIEVGHERYLLIDFQDRVLTLIESVSDAPDILGIEDANHLEDAVDEELFIIYDLHSKKEVSLKVESSFTLVEG